MQRALYASNVYHYEHVIKAMNAVFDEVGLLRRWEVGPHQMGKLSRLPIPRSLLRVVERRSKGTSPDVDWLRSLGVAQMVIPTLTRMGLPTIPGVVRQVNRAYGRRTAHLSRRENFEFLHFVEGLGAEALDLGSYDATLCERRNFHHEFFEAPLQVLNGFPINGKQDPLRDRLNYEYTHADHILVYSEAVRRSFLQRGFPEEKVLVCPIGVGPFLPRLSRERRGGQLLYVGRCDAYKGLDVAVAAVQALGGAYTLRVAGPAQPQVKRWLEAQPRVNYLGILGREELREEYSTATALLAPSYESFGLAPAEAVHHRLPLICSDNTGIAEYLPSTVKTVVVGRDPEAWADAASRMSGSGISDREADAALSGLSPDACAVKLRDIYRAILRAS